jgi:positive regulator of sigma E activity
MSSRYQLIAEGSAAGMLFLLSPLAGYFLGKWLGQTLGVGMVPAYVGGALGLVAAFLNLMRLVERASR